MGMAAATLAGQAVGRGDIDAARRWGWDVVRLGCVYAVGLAVIFISFPGQLMGLFVLDSSIVEIARWPLRVIGIGLIFDVSGIVLSSSLQGVGDMRRVLLVSFSLQWGFMLPVVYLIGPVLGYGLLPIWMVMVLWRVAGVAVYSTLWHRRGWAHIRV